MHCVAATVGGAASRPSWGVAAAAAVEAETCGIPMCGQRRGGCRLGTYRGIELYDIPGNFHWLIRCCATHALIDAK